MQPAITISDLKVVPQFTEVLADRIWNAWWKSGGTSLDTIKSLLDENLQATSLPLALVAHDQEHFMGTISLIASDMEARPDYSPWIAALWVDEPYRQSGIGSALIQAAEQAARSFGFATIYLCAEPDKHDFYHARGWQLLEENIDGLNIYQQAL